MDRRGSELKPGCPLAPDRFLAAIADEEYVLYKSAELDAPRPGQDLDLLCRSVRKIAAKLLTVAHTYFDDGFDVRIEESSSVPVVHIDLMRGDELQLRFDLVEGTPRFANFRFKKVYFDQIIADRRVELRAADEAHLSGPPRGSTQQYPIYRPAIIDELVLRYAEYLALFRTRPDKVKHLDYILAAVRNNGDEMQFLDRLYRFTALPQPVDLHEVEVIGGMATKLSHHLKPWMESLSPRWRRVASLAGRTLTDPVTMFRKLCFRLLATAGITHA